MSFWWLGFLFACSLILTGLFCLYARKMSMIDVPNARSSHVAPTPRGGGVGMIVVFFIGSFFLAGSAVIPRNIMWGMALSGSLVAAVGIIDDHHHVAARWRLAVHFIASLTALFFIGTLPTVPWFSGELNLGWIGFAVALIVLIWSVNLFNFMDGIDGIAGVEAVTVTCGAALIIWLNSGSYVYIQLLLLFAVTALGFLAWNWPPAKIFMGDGASGFLGFMFGFFAIVTSGQEGLNVWSWLILYGVFFVDATVTLLRRILRGDRFYEAHRSHAYQILSRRLQSHLKVTVGVVLINLLWLLPLAVFSARQPDNAFLLAVIALLPLVVLCLRAGAGTTDT